MDDFMRFSVVLVGVFAVFVAIGLHQAVNKLLGIVDGHLERLQAKLDVLLGEQIKHNKKIDLILAKLY